MSGGRVHDAVVVGAGAMGRAWLDVLDRRDDVRVVAIVDVDPDAARAAAAGRGAAVSCHGTVDGALAEHPADLLLNVTVPAAHLAVSAAALRAGVPVLSEKPVTPTVAEALLLAALSSATGTLLATSQSRRHTAGIRAFGAALRELGGAQQLDVRFFQNPRFGGFRDRMDSPLLVDMAIHTFDQARCLLGGEPVSVYCDEFSPTWSWYDGAAAAAAIFRFTGGERFAYSGSWCADGLTTSWNGDWRASAAGGSAAWDGERGVVVERSDAAAGMALDDEPEGLDAALQEFVDALEGGAPPSGEIHRNVHSLAMVQGAVESAASGAPVVLADLFERARDEARARARVGCDDDILAALDREDAARPV